MGGRGPSERVVAINRNSWSRSAGARKLLHHEQRDAPWLTRKLAYQNPPWPASNRWTASSAGGSSQSKNFERQSKGPGLLS
jgi:hypothetical protein